MADNSATLAKGTAKAKNLIFNHILDQCMIPALKACLQDALSKRWGHNNMTGNTVNSYAGAVYFDGVIRYVESASPGRAPIRVKLRKNEIFKKGRRRWDGSRQRRSFLAEIDTSGTAEPDKSEEFVYSYAAPSKGWAMVICNGVEYAEYQETIMGIDTLTDSFAAAKGIIPSHFKPMTA